MASPPPPPRPRQLFVTWAPGSSNDPAFVEPDGRRVPYHALLPPPQSPASRVRVSITRTASRLHLAIVRAASPRVELHVERRGATAVRLDVRLGGGSLPASSHHTSAKDSSPQHTSSLHHASSPQHASSQQHASAPQHACPQDVSATQARLAACAAALGLSSARFRRVPPDYYEHELEWRREALGAHSTKQLCKSMIMENTRLTELSADEASSAGRLKYIIVVLQYDGPKLHRDKLTEVVRALEGSHAAPKKQYNLRMVSSDVSDALSGFEHNAVTPLGMRTRLPLLVSSRLREVSGGNIWLGGGETDLKLNVDIEQFVATLQAAWAPIPVQFADVVG